MNKFKTGLITIAFFLGAGIIIYMLWRGASSMGIGVIFGVALLTGIANLLVSWMARFKERYESDGSVRYDPDERRSIILALLPLLVTGGMFYYATSLLKLSVLDQIAAYLVLTLIAVVPIVYYIYSVFRDKNDFLQFSADNVFYRDNENEVTFGMANVASVRNVKNGISILFTDKTLHLIPTKEMGFDTDLSLKAAIELEKLIPSQNKQARKDALEEPSRSVEAPAPVEVTSVSQSGKAGIVTGVFGIAIIFGLVYGCSKLESQIDRAVVEDTSQKIAEATGNESMKETANVILHFEQLLNTIFLYTIGGLFVFLILLYLINSFVNNRGNDETGIEPGEVKS